MTALREFKVPLPDRMKRLPVDARGFPIPWFVHIDDDGVPDFRVIGRNKFELAVQRDRCWVCGDVLGVIKVFVIGPMCVINRATAEPPSHRECALFAAQACPFLLQPRMVRDTKNEYPEGATKPAGIMLPHNPGATAVYTTRRYHLMKADRGYLIRIGDPLRIEWYAEGRTATGAEVQASISRGLPALYKVAVDEGPDAVNALNSYVVRAGPHMPQDCDWKVAMQDSLRAASQHQHA